MWQLHPKKTILIQSRIFLLIFINIGDQYLVVFGSLGQIEGGIDFSSALLTDRRQLERDRLSKTITGLQLQLGGLSWDLMKVSKENVQISIKMEEVKRICRFTGTLFWETESGALYVVQY